MRRSVTFRPLAEADFPLLTEWRNRPHLVGVYADRPTDLAEVTAKYRPRVRGEEAVIQHIALADGRPFGFLQSYRTADWPDWKEIVDLDAASLDLFIGEPDCIGMGLGKAMLTGYVRDVMRPAFPGLPIIIVHAPDNAPALACSRSVGFADVGPVIEQGRSMLLLRL